MTQNLLAVVAVLLASCTARHSESAMGMPGSDEPASRAPASAGANATPLPAAGADAASARPPQEAAGAGGTQAPPSALPPEAGQEAPAEPTNSAAQPTRAEQPTPDECRAMAEAAVATWYAEVGDRWSFAVTDEALRLLSTEPCDTNSLRFSYQGSGPSFRMNLTCEALHSYSLAAFEGGSPELALGDIPHGIAIPPCNWTFRVLTPANWVNDRDIEFLELSQERVRLQVVTPAFAVQGYSNDDRACPRVADAAAPEHCYVHVRRDVTLDLSYELRIDGPAVEALIEQSPWSE